MLDGRVSFIGKYYKRNYVGPFVWFSLFTPRTSHSENVRRGDRRPGPLSVGRTAQPKCRVPVPLTKLGGSIWHNPVLCNMLHHCMVN